MCAVLVSADYVKGRPEMELLVSPTVVVLRHLMAARLDKIIGILPVSCNEHERTSHTIHHNEQMEVADNFRQHLALEHDIRSSSSSQ